MVERKSNGWRKILCECSQLYEDVQLNEFSSCELWQPSFFYVILFHLINEVCKLKIARELLLGNFKKKLTPKDDLQSPIMGVSQTYFLPLKGTEKYTVQYFHYF